MSKYENRYNKNSIDFVKCYLEEVENLVVMEFIDGDFKEVDCTEYEKSLKIRYLLTGISESLFDTKEEFEEICSFINSK